MNRVQNIPGELWLKNDTRKNVITILNETDFVCVCVFNQFLCFILSSVLNSETFAYVLKTFTVRVYPLNSSFPTWQLVMPLEARIVSKSGPGFSDQNENKTIAKMTTISATRTVSTSGDMNHDWPLFRKQIFLTEL